MTPPTYKRINLYCQAQLDSDEGLKIEDVMKEFIHLKKINLLIDDLDYQIIVRSSEDNVECVNYRAAIIFFNNSPISQNEKESNSLHSKLGKKESRAIIWHLDNREMVENFINNFPIPTKRGAFIQLLSLPRFAAGEVDKFLKKDYAVFKEKHILNNSVEMTNKSAQAGFKV